MQETAEYLVSGIIDQYLEQRKNRGSSDASLSAELGLHITCSLFFLPDTMISFQVISLNLEQNYFTSLSCGTLNQHNGDLVSGPLKYIFHVDRKPFFYGY